MAIQDPDDRTTTLEKELDAQYPHRPHNHSKTLPFHELYLMLFDPLNENKSKPVAKLPRRGKHGPTTLKPQERRRLIIERFISRWRQEVGNDILPAFRLIMPDKDRDRSTYGLKEKAIAKLLVKVMKIDRNSEDGASLLNWKVPGYTVAARMAGDFPGRCYEVLKKRPVLIDPGDMTIEEVNDLLDRLSMASKEENQIPIMEEFYTRMNSNELLWLIRIILRTMKVGASEKTILDIWHPDAEALFNVCSSLRRVCWELPDPSIRLHRDDCGVTLMQSFQPQLAQFQQYTFEKMVDRMRLTPEDDVFWIEEKLDGERMQLHMMDDSSVSGGKRFAFWSRRAKEYTYLYGNGFHDDNSALTRHLQNAFNPSVRSIILDGEMITWDPVEQAVVPFGTLKTAAISESRNPFTTGHRPVFKVFDCLYVNGQAITSYTLRDRRRALETCVRPVDQRLELHLYETARTVKDIELTLRKVISEASEGLVIKSPRSMYRLNDRNDDWIKVKPEYMNEFGEDLDCLIIGGYYGSGKRGGRLSSFLCGLRVDDRHIELGADPAKFLSFVKVGGGFNANDFASIRHHTDGKWKPWDPKKPPSKYVELAGDDLQTERPDEWIHPKESIVIAIKAASVISSDSFRAGISLRFPRFRGLRLDRDWQSALSYQDFVELKTNVEKQIKEKEEAMTFSTTRKKQPRTTKKQAIKVYGQSTGVNAPASDSQLPTFASSDPESIATMFNSLTFHLMSDAVRPKRITKSSLEKLIQSHGGQLIATPIRSVYSEASKKLDPPICIADKKLVKVTSLINSGGVDIILRPCWILDAIESARLLPPPSKDTTSKSPLSFLLPFEPKHIFYASDDQQEKAETMVDPYGDSYVRTIDSQGPELKTVLEKMDVDTSHGVSKMDTERLKAEIHNRMSESATESRGMIFVDIVAFIESISDEYRLEHKRRLSRILQFGGAQVVDSLSDSNHNVNSRVTHVIIVRPQASPEAAGAGSPQARKLDNASKNRLSTLRDELLKLSKTRKTTDGSKSTGKARIVDANWVEESWKAGSRMVEDRFAI